MLYRGGGASQSSRPVASTRIYLEAHLNLRSQFFSSSDSSPIDPAAPYIFDATHMTFSSKKSISTVSGTSRYLSKTYCIGYPTWGICVSKCFSRRTSATNRLVLVQTSPRRRQPPPLQLVNLRAAWRSFSDVTVSWKRRINTYLSPSSFATFPSLSDPLASVSSTRPSCQPASHRSNHLEILVRISLACHAPVFFFIIMCAKTSSFLEF